MLRNNDREQHSYIGGVYEDELEALTEAWAHMKMRAGKYGAEVTGFELGSCRVVYKRELDCWDAFTESCKDLAAKVKEMLDKQSQ